MKKKVKKISPIHVKVGDLVKVISGQYKGSTGVIKNLIKEKSSIIIEGLNKKKTS